MARTGRRPGQSGARDAILASARRSFAEAGYDATTIRGVASSAGVDPALVSHYFGPKEALFAAALELPVRPSEALTGALEGPDEGLGERIAATFLSAWDPVDGGQLAALLRSMGSNEQAASMLTEFVRSELVPLIARRIGGRDAQLRAALAASHLMGVAVARYVLRLEPIASAPARRLRGPLGRAVQSQVEVNT